MKCKPRDEHYCVAQAGERMLHNTSTWRKPVRECGSPSSGCGFSAASVRWFDWEVNDNLDTAAEAGNPARFSRFDYDFEHEHEHEHEQRATSNDYDYEHDYVYDYEHEHEHEHDYEQRATSNEHDYEYDYEYEYDRGMHEAANLRLYLQNGRSHPPAICEPAGGHSPAGPSETTV